MEENVTAKTSRSLIRSNPALCSETLGAFLWDDPDQDQWSKITQIAAHQRNRGIHSGQGFRGSFDAPLIRVILDHWSWSGSSQRNAPLNSNNTDKSQECASRLSTTTDTTGFTDNRCCPNTRTIQIIFTYQMNPFTTWYNENLQYLQMQKKPEYSPHKREFVVM